MPLLVSPRGTTDVPRLTTFVWHSSAYATAYEIQVALDQAFQFIYVDTTLADTTKTLSTPLDPSTVFYWHVCGVDSGGASPYSAVSAFTTGTLLDVKEANTYPKEFALFQNYPNPFNPSTSHQLSVSSKQFGNVEGVQRFLEEMCRRLLKGSSLPGLIRRHLTDHALAAESIFTGFRPEHLRQPKNYCL